MALHESFESPLHGEIHSPEIDFPFSPEVTRNLRVHILIASGAFSRMSITEQLRTEAGDSLISQFVTTKVIGDKPINTDMIVASLEKPQIESPASATRDTAIGIGFFELLNGAIDLDDKLTEIKRKRNDGAKKFLCEIKNIFEKDDILKALDEKIRSGTVPPNEEMSYTRAVLFQKAVLIGINLQKLTY